MKTGARFKATISGGCCLSQRNIIDLTFPFIFKTTFSKKQNIFNRDVDGRTQRNFEHTWHWKTLCYSLISEGGYCIDIVCEQNTSFICSPGEHGRIVCSLKPDVLNSHNIETWQTPQNAFDNVHIEVLI